MELIPYVPYVITFSLGRKALVLASWYLVGGILVSTVGLVPALAISSILWLV